MVRKRYCPLVDCERLLIKPQVRPCPLSLWPSGVLLGTIAKADCKAHAAHYKNDFSVVVFGIRITLTQGSSTRTPPMLLLSCFQFLYMAGIPLSKEVIEVRMP